MKVLLWLAVLLLGVGCSARAQNISEQYLLAAANNDRAEHGLLALTIDEHLTQAAQKHANAMAKHGTISHQFDGEADLAARGGEAGAHFSLITENVAEASNAALIHELWMHSAGHRANLLDAAVNAVGIAVVQVGGQLFAVEDFGKTVVALSLREQEVRVEQMLVRQGLRSSDEYEDARQTCGMKTGYAGERQPWFVMRYTSSDIERLPQELTARIATGRFHTALVGACGNGKQGPFSSYTLAVLLYP